MDIESQMSTCRWGQNDYLSHLGNCMWFCLVKGRSRGIHIELPRQNSLTEIFRELSRQCSSPQRYTKIISEHT